jgi:hypothetical protein
MAKINVTAATARCCFDRVRQLAVRRDQELQSRIPTVTWIDIEHNNPRRTPGANPKVGFWPSG